MTDPSEPANLLDPARLLGLPADDERVAALAAAFEDIRASIEALRAYEIEDPHPAVVFRPAGDDR